MVPRSLWTREKPSRSQNRPIGSNRAKGVSKAATNPPLLAKVNVRVQALWTYSHSTALKPLVSERLHARLGKGLRGPTVRCNERFLRGYRSRCIKSVDDGKTRVSELLKERFVIVPFADSIV
jgi:hypothetical protein